MVLPPFLSVPYHRLTGTDQRGKALATMAMIIILMGVSGVGKTTIGRLLAQDLGWPFYDGDDFHPQANVDKMRQGIPLTDADRDAWLAALRHLIDTLVQKRQSATVACSALKQAYRERLGHDLAGVRFIYLKGDYALLYQRLQARHGHFMPADLLRSQFATLEEPGDILVIDVKKEPETIVQLIKRALGL
jgi:gluconokinase